MGSRHWMSPIFNISSSLLSRRLPYSTRAGRSICLLVVSIKSYNTLPPKQQSQSRIIISSIQILDLLFFGVASQLISIWEVIFTLLSFSEAVVASNLMHNDPSTAVREESLSCAVMQSEHFLFQNALLQQFEEGKNHSRCCFLSWHILE